MTNNGGDRDKSDPLLSPNEAFRTRFGVNLMELLPKEPYHNSKRTLVVKTVSFYLKPASVVPWLKIALSQLIEHTDVKLEPT